MKRILLAVALIVAPVAAQAQTYGITCRSGADLTYQMVMGYDNKPLSTVSATNIVGVTCREDNLVRHHIKGVSSAVFESVEDLNMFLKNMRVLFGGTGS